MLSRAHAIPLAVACLVATSCGGGVQHVADITPAVRQQLSGAWILNEQESDDPEEVLRGAGGAPAAARGGRDGRVGGGGQPPAGGGGGVGVAGRGGMPGGGDAPRGRGDPAAMVLVRRLATGAPRNLQISLTDSMVVLSLPREEPWLLPFGGDVEREIGEGVKVKAKAEWDNGRLVVTRTVAGGGSVAETFMPSVDGKRLTVAVEFLPRGRPGIEFRRVYQVGERGSRVH